MSPRKYRIVAEVETPDKIMPLKPGVWDLMREDEKVTITSVELILSAEDALYEIETLTSDRGCISELALKRIIARYRSQEKHDG